jgi:hypothetical protein
LLLPVVSESVLCESVEVVVSAVVLPTLSVLAVLAVLALASVLFFLAHPAKAREATIMSANSFAYFITNDLLETGG